MYGILQQTWESLRGVGSGSIESTLTSEMLRSGIATPRGIYGIGIVGPGRGNGRCEGRFSSRRRSALTA